jgi:hypothetical protein
MKRIALSCVALMTIAGCSTVQVRSTPAPGVNLGQFHTFGFMPDHDPNSKTAMFDRSPAGQEVRNRITQDLTAKGYVLAQADQQPDFLVATHSKTQEKLDVQDWGYPGPYWGYGWNDTTVTQYTEGTIIVDFVDPKANQVFWRGTASSVVNHPENPDLNRLSKAVNKLMKTVPAQMAAAPAPARM